MPISTTFAAVFINLASTILPLMGIQVGTDALTTTVQTIVAIVTGLWILKQRYARGDVKMSGLRK